MSEPIKDVNEEQPLSFGLFQLVAYELKQQMNRSNTSVNQIKKWTRDLKTNPRYKTFFEKYDPSSIDPFINFYVYNKQNWIEDSEDCKLKMNNRTIAFKEDAFNCLWEIQQKKLFDMQCKWRAGEVTINEVDITYDFIYWQEHIHECPFIPPITQDEVDIYKKYLLCGDYQVIPVLYKWQDYDSFKAALKDQNKEEMPVWYLYYDAIRLDESPFLFPDVRGAKEEFYIKLSENYDEAELRVQQLMSQSIHLPPSGLPFLNCLAHPSQLVDFIKEFEDSKLLKNYYNYISVEKRVGSQEEYVDEIWLKIRTIDEPIPIQKHENWREALIDAWNWYRHRKIAETLQAVFDEYTFRVENKISHPVTEQKFRLFNLADKRCLVGMILHGRELNGEPDDLNF